VIQRLAVRVECKADLAKREVTGYASTFGNVDLGGDIVLPGAYTKTLADDLPAGRIKVRRNHREAIGRPIHAEQDSTGLLTVSRISETPLGDETLVLVADGVVDAMSIGYVAEEKRYATREGRKVRELVQIRLAEWSLLDEPPMNPEAIVTGLKAKATAAYDVGDRVRALVAHMPGMKGKLGTIEIVHPGAPGGTYGVRFDGDDEVHKWYVEDELAPSDEETGAEDEKAPKKPKAPHTMANMGKALHTITGVKGLGDAMYALDQVRWLLEALRTAATAHPKIVELAREVIAEFDGFLSTPAPLPDPDAAGVIALFGELRQTLINRS
jgi:HK97 family phage prohead protease